MSYIGFNKLSEKLKKQGVNNPGAVAATIARKKYGKKAVQEHAAAGTSMKHAKHKALERIRRGK